MSQPQLVAVPAPLQANSAGAEPPVAWQARKKTVPDRHGAIARQLFTYRHYKSWADKMRSSWAEDEAEAKAEESQPRR
jgi:hypothetical protein